MGSTVTPLCLCFSSGVALFCHYYFVFITKRLAHILSCQKLVSLAQAQARSWDKIQARLSEAPSDYFANTSIEGHKQSNGTMDGFQQTLPQSDSSLIQPPSPINLHRKELQADKNKQAAVGEGAFITEAVLETACARASIRDGAATLPREVTHSTGAQAHSSTFRMRTRWRGIRSREGRL